MIKSRISTYITTSQFSLFIFPLQEVTIRFLAPKKIAKVTTPAVEAASDFDDDIPF
jgi:hypothetical protein